MGHGRSFRLPAIVALAAAGLTQLFYPYFYEQLLGLNNLWLLVALTLRNISTLFLFGWAVRVVIGLTRPFAQHEALADTDTWLPSAWPFTERRDHSPSHGEDDSTYEDSTAQ
jgi:hypothetical protein